MREPVNWQPSGTTTDFKEENKKRALEYFREAEIKTKIEFRLGDAIRILDKIDGDFDIIFNDVEKEDYPEVYIKSIPKLRKGGLLISDNTLWYGKVAQSEVNDYQTAGSREYNRLAFSDERVLSVIIPLRDGITISMKL